MLDTCAAVPPQNIEAERSVLGACLIERDAVSRAVEVIHDPEAFYRGPHRAIYDAMLSLHARGEPVDIITVSDELDRKSATANAGGIEYLMELTTVVPTAANVQWYAQTVRERARRREAIAIAARVVQSAHDLDADLDETVSAAAASYTTLLGTASDAQSVSAPELMREWAANLDAGPTRLRSTLRTGFRAADEMLGGYTPSEVWYLSGRPGDGKTTFMLQLAHRAARAGHPVLVCSMELGRHRVAERLAAIDSGVRSRTIQFGPQAAFEAALPDLLLSVNRLIDIPHLHFVFGRATTQQVTAIGRQMKLRYGRAPILKIDRLEYISDVIRAPSPRERIVELTRRVKGIATTLDAPVVCLCQQSRAGRAEEEPTMSGFQESGSIEQDCQAAIVIRIKDGKNDPNHGTIKDPVYGARLHIVKQNDGPTGKSSEMRWKPRVPAFYDLDTVHADPPGNGKSTAAVMP